MKRAGSLAILFCLIALGLGGGLTLASTPPTAAPVVVGETILVVKAGGDLHFLDLEKLRGAPPAGGKQSLPPGAQRVVVKRRGNFLSVSFQLPLSFRAFTWLKTFPYAVEGHLSILTGPGVQLPVIINQVFFSAGTQKINGLNFATYTTIKPIGAGASIPINLQINAATEISPAARAAGNLLLGFLALVFMLAAVLVVSGRRSWGLRENPETLRREADELGEGLRTDPAEREGRRRLGEVLAGLKEARRV